MPASGSTWPPDAERRLAGRRERMSEFEYVSVGIALVYSFTVARLVASLPAVLAPVRRYWVHGLWTLVLLLATVSTWWTIWQLREVEWNPLRFMWALTVPALIYLRAGILLSDAPAAVESWRAHFYERRVPFFGVGVLIACNFGAMPLLMGFSPWSLMSSAYVPLALMLGISIGGLVSSKPAVHGTLVLGNLLMVLVSMAAASI